MTRPIRLQLTRPGIIPITITPTSDAERELQLQVIETAMTQHESLRVDTKDGRTIVVNSAHILYAE